MLRRSAFASVRARKNKGNERLVDARADADLDRADRYGGAHGAVADNPLGWVNEGRGSGQMQ